MPTGYDSEIGNIFCEMRRASQLTKEQLAERFATDLSTIDALETGALLALPDWAETSRVVNAYTEALGLDGRPILRRMALQLSPDTTTQRSSRAAEPPPPPAQAPPAAPQRPAAPPTTAAPPVSTPAREPAPARAREDIEVFDQFEPLPPAPDITESLTADARPGYQPEPPVRRKPKRSIARRLLRMVMALVMLIASATGVWYLSQRPGGLFAVIDNLPDPIPRFSRAAWELLRPLDESSVPDPRSRKSDRLPVSGKSPENQ